MATRKQKQELMDTLKFTPVKAHVQIYGYGGECYMGRVTREEYEFYKQHKIDLDQIASDWNDDGKWNFIPNNLQIFPPGSPYECDNLMHASGATMDDGSTIQIQDENDNTLWSSTLDISALTKAGVKVVAGGDVFSNDDELKDGDIVFWGGQGEKGIFFDGEITLRAPFDPKQLVITYADGDGWVLSSGVEYAGEDVEGYDGYSTTGKWAEHKFYIQGDEEVYVGEERDDIDDESEEDEEASDEDWDPAAELDKIDVPVLEGEEMWAQQAIDDAMLSPWHPGDVNPVRKGFYDVEYQSGSWPWPMEDRIKWTGKKWQHNRGEATEVKRWRGLNQPAE